MTVSSPAVYTDPFWGQSAVEEPPELLSMSSAEVNVWNKISQRILADALTYTDRDFHADMDD